jgi:mannose-6-phosphate isomerase-like protein (cupin superfamily)
MAERDPSAPRTISKKNATAFTWRDTCEGWTLVDIPHLHVIQERMPTKTFELRHVHHHTRQFYYVLDGEAAVEIDKSTNRLDAGEGIEIPVGVPHQMRNDSQGHLEFLVISTGRPREDRTDL